MKVLYILKKTIELILEVFRFRKSRFEGIKIFENYLSTDKCDELIANIEKYIDEGKSTWVDSEESDFRIFGVDRINNQFMSALTSNEKFNELDQVYENYTGQKIIEQESFIMCNRIKFKDNSKGSGGGWHRDRFNKRQVKLIIYLNDVTVENGAFQLVRGSEKPLSKLLRCFTDLELPGKLRYGNDLQSKDIMSVEAKKGSLVMVDSTCIHRGMPVKSKSAVRYAMTLYSFENKIPSHIEKQLIRGNNVK